MGVKSDKNTPETTEKLKDKMQSLQDICRLLMNYQDWVTEETWNARFDLQMDMYLEQVADTNMRIFMGMQTEADMQTQKSRVARTRLIKPANLDDGLNAV